MNIATMRSYEPSYGTWLSSGSPVVAELAARCGLDWLLFDLEHGCLTESDLLHNLQAASGHGSFLVVRIPTHETGLIGRVLDWGADAIMVPHVESAAEAGALVQAMRYPPEGRRGYSRSVRAYGYGLKPPGARPLLFVQIESVAGVSAVDEIAGVEGVDVLFVGPADLRLSLSAEPSAPSYEEALAEVTAAARRRGVEAGILVRDRNEIPGLLRRGFTRLAVDSDLMILRAGFLLLRGA